MRQIIVAAALLVGCVLSAPLRSDEPVSSSVTFSREVIRIFERKCLPCHAPGGIAMSLATYREARPWARAIREELVEGRMPPWRPAPGYGAFANDIGLTGRELTMILTWTDGGVPRGDDRDLPRRAPDHRHAGPVEADNRLELPAQSVPAGEEYVVRRVTIDPGATRGRWIRRIEVVPSDTRVMRAAFVSVVPGDGRSPAHWIGAWTPWLHTVAPPDGVAFPLRAGARLVVELHYRGRDTDLVDRSSLALFFAPEGQSVAGEIVVATAPAPSTDRRVRQRGESRLRQETRIWAIVPHVSTSAAGDSGDPDGDATGTTSLEVTARKPDGSVEVLLWIPQRRHDWPTPYVLQKPILLPADTTVVVTTSAPLGTASAETLTPSTVTLSTYRSSG